MCGKNSQQNRLWRCDGGWLGGCYAGGFDLNDTLKLGVGCGTANLFQESREGLIKIIWQKLLIIWS